MSSSTENDISGGLVFSSKMIMRMIMRDKRKNIRQSGSDRQTERAVTDRQREQ